MARRVARITALGTALIVLSLLSLQATQEAHARETTHTRARIDQRLQALHQRRSAPVLPGRAADAGSSLSLPTPLVPGQQAPSFKLPTLDGGVFSYLSGGQGNSTYVVLAYNQQSAFLECMWTHDEYLDPILMQSPPTLDYLFMAYANDTQGATKIVSAMRDRLNTRMLALGFESRQRNDWNKRLHYLVTPVDQQNNWIQSLLNTWNDALDFLEVKNGSLFSTSYNYRRIDAQWPWLPQLGSTVVPLPIVYVGDSCQGIKQVNVTGRVALIARSSHCSFAEQIGNAESAGAIAAVVYTTEIEPMIDMDCEGFQCDLLLGIPGTMISYEDGMQLRQMLSANASNVSVFFRTYSTSGFQFAIDGQGAVQEMGYVMYPSFLFFIYEGQYMNYIDRLIANTTMAFSDDRELVIPVFNRANTTVGAINSTVTLPSLEVLRSYRTIYLDLSLGCPGPFDSSCPAWDRILSLFVCCDGAEDLCGQEIGRWITPFGRSVGRWLTPIEQLIPMLAGGQCRFTISWGTTELWVPSLSLRFQGQNPSKDAPASMLALFSGGTFNQQYNSIHNPISFTVPNGTTRAVLVAVITGHGSDNHNCAEFCVTEHNFYFNENRNNIKFTNAGSPMGCADEVMKGVIPNEYGTWLYGRDGWCDGLEVMPWVVDVTAQVSMNANNTIEYTGYFHDHTPNPQPPSSAGYIVMYSYLVFYSNI